MYYFEEENQTNNEFQKKQRCQPIITTCSKCPAFGVIPMLLRVIALSLHTSMRFTNHFDRKTLCTVAAWFLKWFTLRNDTSHDGWGHVSDTLGSWCLKWSSSTCLRRLSTREKDAVLASNINSVLLRQKRYTVLGSTRGISSMVSKVSCRSLISF